MVTKAITKKEVLQRLSKQLRKPDLDDKTFIKVMSLYAKLAGFYDEPPTPSPAKVPVKGPTLNEIVLAEERKRREEGNK